MRVIRWVVASLVCFLVGLAPVSVFAQTAEELVAKNLQARGGVEKMKAIKSLRMTGKFDGNIQGAIVQESKR
ncbi:MAG TPA: hypothetical protein VKL99_02920, partial [Candidatus Angelobacter sp.]|nr:hypothetical protein [Candidatus Angelobacter sp.]